jgi:hypothetical protein
VLLFVRALEGGTPLAPPGVCSGCGAPDPAILGPEQADTVRAGQSRPGCGTAWPALLAKDPCSRRATPPGLLYQAEASGGWIRTLYQVS